MGLFKKNAASSRKTTFPIDVIGVLVNPQNIQFWDECWCLPNALEASGLPVSIDWDGRGWSYGAVDVQRSGDVYLMLLKSPAGNMWQAKWLVEGGDMVRYHFSPLNESAGETPTEAGQLAGCCDRRGGCL